MEFAGKRWYKSDMGRLTYRSTIGACFAGHVVQAVVNNYAPLLFLTFQREFGIPLEKITVLVSWNFMVQLAVDLISSKAADRIGYRASMVLAHLFAFLGLAAMALLPFLMDPFTALMTAVTLYAIGGGITEVLLSPMVEACPTANKERIMSLLHSFYCWGVVAVILLSSIFFLAFGTVNWRILAIFWAMLPLLNGILFLFVPIAPLLPAGEGSGIGKLVSQRTFRLLFVVMICSGAAEQSMAQWASLFAEEQLGMAKAEGDIAGAMLFAVAMGTVRALYAKFSKRIAIERIMIVSAFTCIAGYLMVSCVADGMIPFIGMIVIGLSVALFWPGTFMIAPRACPKGGTTMFALLALGGDLGCSLGPGTVGAVSAACGDDLAFGLASAILFPLVLAMAIRALKKKKAE